MFNSPLALSLWVLVFPASEDDIKWQIKGLERCAGRIVRKITAEKRRGKSTVSRQRANALWSQKSGLLSVVLHRLENVFTVPKVAQTQRERRKGEEGLLGLKRGKGDEERGGDIFLRVFCFFARNYNQKGCAWKEIFAHLPISLLLNWHKKINKVLAYAFKWGLIKVHQEN